MSMFLRLIMLGVSLSIVLSACANGPLTEPVQATETSSTSLPAVTAVEPEATLPSPTDVPSATSEGAPEPTATTAPPLTPIWEQRAPLLESNSELSVAELDGKIYALGGYPASRQTVDTVQIYDSATDTWRIGPPLPAASNHNVAVAAEGRVYLIGGQPTAQGGGPFLQDVFAYDPASDSWSDRSPLPLPRSGMAGAALDGKIYVAGGRPPMGHEFAVYDPQTDQWTRLPEMPTARNHFVVAALNGEIYALGGRFGAGFSSEVTDIVEIFDPETGEWRPGTPMPTKRSGHNGIVANGCLHIMGGEGNGAGNVKGLYPQHEVYNPQTDTWTSLDPMPV
ncbi:MAG: kelch repeat-containing protein, partial [Anaerolineales bacterium]|nr:kelch repeat-containing protein [Anaerolineales bacterium]